MTDLALTKRGEDYLLQLGGVMDERVRFTQVVELIKPAFGGGAKLVVDFANLVSINSVAIREWCLFIELVQSRMPVEFYRLNEVMILQASLINGTLGRRGTPVHEIEIPYFCPACRIRTTAFVKTSAAWMNGSLIVPESGCGKCGQPMDFDAIEEEYVEVLRR